jgi:prepilin peptidase CpaA
MHMWTTALWDCGWAPLQWTAVAAITLVAAGFDAAQRRIPNRLTGPSLLAGLGASALLAGASGLADSAAAAALLALPYVLLFALAGGGAGDAKLMAVVGSWLGLVNGLLALIGVSVAAVALAIGAALARRRLLGLLTNLGRMTWGLMYVLLLHGPSRRSFMPPAGQNAQKLPYGIAIFAGVCLSAAGVLTWRWM